jgi:RNA polymerase sigma-70 factor, ECF subfamily
LSARPRKSDIPEAEKALVIRAKARLPDGKGTPDALAAFAELVRSILAALLGTLVGFGMTAQRAEEFAQEALAAAWKALPAYKHDFRFLTWVTKIAHNEFLTEVASRKGKQASSERIELDPRDASPDDTPEKAALREERLAMIHRLAENLPDDKMRQAFVYRHIEGLSYEEIAQIMAPLKEEDVTRLARQGLDRIEYATRHEREGGRR